MVHTSTRTDNPNKKKVIVAPTSTLFTFVLHPEPHRIASHRTASHRFASHHIAHSVRCGTLESRQLGTSGYQRRINLLRISK